ncbi:hypothetical protein ACRAWD_03185 [Caulobacter segnis]
MTGESSRRSCDWTGGPRGGGGRLCGPAGRRRFAGKAIDRAARGRTVQDMPAPASPDMPITWKQGEIAAGARPLIRPADPGQGHAAALVL